MVALVIYHRDGNLSILDDFPVVDTIPLKLTLVFGIHLSLMCPAPFVQCC